MQTKKSNLTIRIEPQLKEEAAFSIVRLSGAMDFHLKSSWMNPMRSHTRQWMTQKTAETCMAHTTA